MLVKYNGVALPEYPTDINIDDYPYRWIRNAVNADGCYDLAISTNKFYYRASDNKMVVDGGSERWYKVSPSGLSDASTWTLHATYGSDTWTMASRSLLWTANDMPIDSIDGTEMYAYGNEPVYPEPIVYANVEEIVAGVENAMQLRTNSKQDDGVDTVAGVDWFTYAGNVCTSMYASGNSWIGIGKSSEDLKVNRRDAAMWNLWREEGTVGTARFLRIRWSGYTNYSATDVASLMTYDVLFFDTGDICLYMVDVPTSNYPSGTFTLGSLTFTAPTEANRYVLFTKQEDGSYSVSYEAPSFYIKRYLIKNNDVIYTVTDGALTELTGTLNAELFRTSGLESPPDGALLLPLTAPQVLCWSDAPTAPAVTATVQGVPVGEHSVISDHIRVGHSSIYGIASVTTTASEGATFALSFDGGDFMTYTEEGWTVAVDSGMSGTELEAIPAEAWNSVINSAQYMQLRATLDGVDTVTQVKFIFNNNSPIPQGEESEV